ncbi:Uncharacterized protein QTN25_001575 [Entamoeba marina]
MQQILNATSYTCFLPPAPPHFPALSGAINSWNNTNLAIETIINSFQPNFAQSELLGLLYRFSGTLSKHAKKLTQLGSAPEKWPDIKMNYETLINSLSLKTKENEIVNPEQFVYDLASDKLNVALQLLEEFKMERKTKNEELKQMFIVCRNLFQLLMEWCDKEDETTMVKKCFIFTTV